MGMEWEGVEEDWMRGRYVGEERVDSRGVDGGLSCLVREQDLR